MQVEFETTVTNGVIELPKEWKDKMVGVIEVTLRTKAAEAERENPMEQAYQLANQTAAERGAALWREASLHQAEISAAAAAAFAEMGISGEPVSIEELHKMMLADGVNPNDNEFSRGIIEMREE